MLVVTEPRCKNADIFFWEKLAEVSQRVLKLSGFLVAYCGQKLFDRIVGVLSKYLRYHWMYCVGGNGNGDFIQNGIFEEWQPVLVYYKPPFDNKKISESIYSNALKKDEKWIACFIEMLSSPNNLVFDPVAETDYVIKVAQSLNRKIIGIKS